MKSGGSKAFHFKPYPEIKLLIQRKCTNKKGFLLTNGLKCPLENIKLKGKTVKVYVINTCGFDSLIHILQFAALDNPVYFHLVQKSNNQMLRFLNKFMSEGETRNIRSERCTILKTVYEIKKPPLATSIEAPCLDAQDFISRTWENFSGEESTAIRQITCSNPLCPDEKATVPHFYVNHRTIKRDGCEALQKALQFHPLIDNIKCRTKGCHGLRTWRTKPGVHVFIELDIKTSVDEETGMECMLKSFPLTLDLGSNYRLAGVIGYRSGHFTAYCLRTTGTWLKCDDMLDKIYSCDKTLCVVPHAVIYIKE